MLGESPTDVTGRGRVRRVPSSLLPTAIALCGLIYPRSSYAAGTHASALPAFAAAPGPCNTNSFLQLRSRAPARLLPSRPPRTPRAPQLAPRARLPALLQMRLGAEAEAPTAAPAEDLEAGPPVLDVSELSADSLDVDSLLVAEMAAAAKKWGFFQMVNHGVDLAIVKRFDAAQEAFFAQDKAEKYKIKRTHDNSRGYFDDELTKQTRDWKECVDIGAQDGDLNGRSPVDGFNQWPEEDGEFRAAMEEYFRAMEGLTERVLKSLALGLGMPADHFDPLFQGHSAFLRINHYPPCATPVEENFPLRSPTEDEGFLAINRHTDSGVLTILRQRADDPHSLQVYVSAEEGRGKDHSSREGRWIVVRPVEGAMTVNVGDMMQVYSNDKYVAPLHRVLAHRERKRYSAPFFFNPPYKEDCAPLPSLGEPLYSAVNWGDFRLRRFQGDFADTGKEVQISDFRAIPDETASA